MNTLFLVGLIVTVWLMLQTAVLWKVSRAGWSPPCGVGRVAFLAGLRLVVTVGLWVLAASLHEDIAGALGLAGTVIVTDVCLAPVLFRWLHVSPAKKAVKFWGSQFVGGFAASFLVIAMAGTCLGMAYIPNSSMSPNIRGYHVVETLPDGTHLVIAANTPGDPDGIPPGMPSGAILAETYESRDAPRPERHQFPADRVLWNNTKTPQRWDAVVFSYPDRPGDTFIKRVVGLPGERMEIRDGAAWANGERLSPPARLGPIRYTAAVAGRPDQWALEMDECFLLGDNTDHCADSRHCGPVPLRLIDGVVTAIYWPPGRWKLDP